MPSTRRLAAILAADVAGYSRLIGADEQGTLERLRAIRTELINPSVAAHNGRIVKTTGDGFLAEFGSTVDALQSAQEIQAVLRERNSGMTPQNRIDFRIGVHQGDIVVEDGDIFGDGVNIAARLEALAEPGGICVSARVQEDATGKLELAFRDMGEQQLKNIARPVRVYALRPEGKGDVPTANLSSTRSSSTPPAAPRLSIVVLPFANLSNDPEQQYFADGITEDLTTDLSRIPGTFVISRNTAFTYQNRPVDTKQIGRELGVRYVLEGSVQRSGNRVRITAQLIDAETNGHLWAERFAGSTDDLYALQDEITGRIAVELHLELVGVEAARPIVNPNALDYIFRGRAALNKPSMHNNYADAVEFFEDALALDSGSVDAQAFLAFALTGRVLDQMSDSVEVDLDRADMLTERALAVSPRHPIAHFAKGQILRAQGRFEAAIPAYETAIAFNPNWALASAALGLCKLLAGAIEEAIPAQERAIRLSPRDPRIANWYWRVGMVHLLQSRIGEAIRWLEKSTNLNPLPAGPHAWLASAYALEGDAERAAVELVKARELSSDGRYSSVNRFRLANRYSGNVLIMAESTVFAGLRKAGMPEE
jgi:TolB-like protein/Tfp pilus assembly protein PilF